MTNTDETFPPGTAAQRIEHSIRALTAGIRYELLELESHPDVMIAHNAEATVGDISYVLNQLHEALRPAVLLLQQQGVRVAGRDIEEEDRRQARVALAQEELFHDLYAKAAYTDSGLADDVQALISDFKQGRG